MDTGYALAYRAALAVARALGLVEAEAEPEPERPEPKFVKDQVVKLESGKTGRIAEIIWGPDSSMASMEAPPAQWWYRLVEHIGYFGECELSPRTMSVTDLTDDQRRMLPGDEVRVVDVPVGSTGLPYPKGDTGELPGTIFTIDVMERDVGLPMVRHLDGREFWLHNLTLVELGD